MKIALLVAGPKGLNFLERFPRRVEVTQVISYASRGFQLIPAPLSGRYAARAAMHMSTAGNFSARPTTAMSFYWRAGDIWKILPVKTRLSFMILCFRNCADSIRR